MFIGSIFIIISGIMNFTFNVPLGHESFLSDIAHYGFLIGIFLYFVGMIMIFIHMIDDFFLGRIIRFARSKREDKHNV